MQQRLFYIKAAVTSWTSPGLSLTELDGFPLYEMVGAIRSPPQRESNIRPIICQSEQKREEPNGEEEIMSTSSERLE